MAIIDSIPGLQVAVINKTKPLKEYRDDAPVKTIGTDAKDFEGEKATCYVECLAEENFGIQFTITEQYKPTSPILWYEIYIDGQWICNSRQIIPESITQPLKLVRTGCWEPDFARGVSELKNFRFKNFKTSRLQLIT
jgi:hypothetical protein